MCAKSADDRTTIAEALNRARRIVVTTHVRPDGDALGSMLALFLAAGRAGKECRMVALDSIPRRYRFLFDRHEPDSSDRFAELSASAELIVVVDTCSYAQLAPIAETLKAGLEKVVVIDHHVTADVPAVAVWRDESAAAAGVMVAELLAELNWPLTGPVAEALLVAICCDTGWFRYANTSDRALRVAAGLVGAGVRPDVIHGKLYQSDRPQRVSLLAAGLGSLELHAGGRLAVMTLTQADFARTQAAPEETEDFANEPLRIGSVVVAALLVEQSNGIVRGSLRSRRGADVAKIAARFGGGGHAQASGFRAEGDISAVKQRLIAAAEEAIQASGA